jgi:hypothetical protein
MELPVVRDKPEHFASSQQLYAINFHRNSTRQRKIEKYK